MGFFSQAGSFLVHVIFGILIFIILLRFIMQMVRADFRNPLSQGIYRLTNPMLMPFRKIIPGLGGIDLASIVLLILLQYAMITLLNVMIGSNLEFIRNLIETPFALFGHLMNIYLFSILIMVIVSWISPNTYNPVIGIINQIIEPIMRPIRKRLPTAGGFDLSPMVAIIAITLVKMAVPHLYLALIRAFGMPIGALTVGH